MRGKAPRFGSGGRVPSGGTRRTRCITDLLARRYRQSAQAPWGAEHWGEFRFDVKIADPVTPLWVARGVPSDGLDARLRALPLLRQQPPEARTACA